jgi:ribosomal protein L11 methyltransferase
MKYEEVKIKISQDLIDIIIAELSSEGYDSFMETEEGVTAYIEEDKFDESHLEFILSKYTSPDFTHAPLEDKNWNEEWEKNFEPIIVNETVVVRASFHKILQQYPYEVVIDPKMSFGTGHHETTYMMIQNLLEIDHTGKKLMDAGTGTGILAILASKLGAMEIFAYDIEDWAFENLKENCNLNGCNNIKVAKGTIEDVSVPFPSCEIVLANINKNVLLHEIPAYSRILASGGHLVLSGFYESDIQDLLKITDVNSLKLLNQKTRNNWASLVLQKL